MLSYQYRIPMLKIRRPRDRLVFNMGIPIPGKDGLYTEMGPRIHLPCLHYLRTPWRGRTPRLGPCWHYFCGESCAIVSTCSMDTGGSCGRGCPPRRSAGENEKMSHVHSRDQSRRMPWRLCPVISNKRPSMMSGWVSEWLDLMAFGDSRQPSMMKTDQKGLWKLWMSDEKDQLMKEKLNNNTKMNEWWKWPMHDEKIPMEDGKYWFEWWEKT